jgi:hypothetical protein
MVMKATAYCIISNRDKKKKGIGKSQSYRTVYDTICKRYLLLISHFKYEIFF